MSNIVWWNSSGGAVLELIIFFSYVKCLKFSKLHLTIPPASFFYQINLFIGGS